MYVLKLRYWHRGHNFYRQQTKFAKVMFLHLSVSHSVHGGVCFPDGVACPRGGGCSGGGSLLPGGAWSLGCVCLLLGGVCSLGGCLVETPLQDGYCCWRYASYWNAFLSNIVSVKSLYIQLGRKYL